MDDLIDGLIGTGIGLVFIIAVAGLYAIGWLAWKFCEYVLVPFCQWLWQEGCEGWRRLKAWYIAVTWRRRSDRFRKEAMATMDDIREQHVAYARAQLEALSRQSSLLDDRTADRTAAVRTAVRETARAA